MADKKILLILILFPLLFTVAAAQTVMETEVDWSKGIVNLDLTTPLPVTATPLPTLKYRLQREMDSQFPIFLREALSPLLVDSRRTFAEALREEAELLKTIAHAGEGLHPLRTHLSQDLNDLILSYQFTLYPDIIRPLVPETSTDPLPSQWGYEPSAPFTGIVIYAAEPLPVHGERDDTGAQAMGLIRPCILPKIFNEDMDPILSAANVAPFYRETWGICQFTTSLEPEDRRTRVGDYPFYTMAVGLFGVNDTDIILSNEAVRKLLSRDDTRRLLREGRITVIIPR